MCSFNIIQLHVESMVRLILLQLSFKIVPPHFCPRFAIHISYSFVVNMIHTISGKRANIDMYFLSHHHNFPRPSNNKERNPSNGKLSDFSSSNNKTLNARLFARVITTGACYDPP